MEKIYEFFDKVIVINIVDQTDLEHRYKNVECVVCDARDMSSLNEAEYVFSNAVIEHVGTFSDQKKFTDEVLKLAKRGYFITTPNVWFPMEPHYCIPFGQYIPNSWLKALNKLIPLGWVKRGEWDSWPEFNLLSAKQLRSLFPNAHIQKLRTTLLPEVLIAYRKY